MANTKSAEKRARQAKARNERNKSAKTALRTQVKKFRTAVAEGDASQADELLRAAHAVIDRTAKRGIIHRSTASRYKSRLAKARNQLSQS